MTALPVSPDWNDVIRRARRSRARAVAARAGIVAAIALAAASPALGLGGWLDALRPGHSVPPARLGPADVHRLSALIGARPVALDHLRTSAERRAALARFGLVDVKLVGRLRGESFYVVDLRDGARCYGAGTGVASRLFSVLSCPAAAGFPSAAEPVLDLSARVGGRTTLVGFAVDGVRSVRTTVGGHVVTIPVVDNVFARPGVAGAGSSALVALDAQDRSIGTPRAAGQATCAVRIYLDPAASSTDVSEAIAAVRSTPHVARLTFVSKGQALQAMRKKYPGLTRDITVNPLPASITIVPDRAANAAGVARRLRAERLADVVKVSSSGC